MVLVYYVLVLEGKKNYGGVGVGSAHFLLSIFLWNKTGVGLDAAKMISYYMLGDGKFINLFAYLIGSIVGGFIGGQLGNLLLEQTGFERRMDKIK